MYHRFIERMLSFIVLHKFSWLLVVCSLGIALDQATKIWVQSSLADPYQIEEIVMVDGQEIIREKLVYYPIRIITVIPKFFNLAYKENPAAAFSLTHSIPEWFRIPMLITASLLATIFFLIWYVVIQKDGLGLLAVSLIVAGAIGNLTDRIRLGYVIDFLDIHAGFIGYAYLHWPTFNIADILIVTGAIGIVFRAIRPIRA